MQEKLNRFARNITSQHGEDGILEYIISSLGDKIHKVACEFGAWDGVFASNIYNLWHNLGWKAVLIEGDSAKYNDLTENIKGGDVIAINQYISIQGKDSVDDIFSRNGISPQIGVLSIDIDSFDYHVWKYLNHVSPQIVIIEHNQHIPPHIEYYDPEDCIYLKCSAKALESLGREKGYKLICCTRTNSIFLKDELFDNRLFPDMPVEYLFDYSALTPQLIFTGENANKYPIFSRKSRGGMQKMVRIYYWISSRLNRKQTYRKPPESVVRQIRAMGMDV